MEDILASIRRIISDDQALPIAPRDAQSGETPVPQPAAEPAPAPAAVIELAAARANPQPRFQPSPAPREPAPVPVPAAAPVPLVSRTTGDSVAASFGALNATLAAPSPEKIEAMSRDMLRPLLKSWLDDHLPALVERLVRAEIERVSRGR
ncbi:MAG: DUF2497 domain-containing protein [Hyphomicrobiales bacterium]|nr:DUF2497 domain-containing protein [Hyphomicrobiales bacterium]